MRDKGQKYIATIERIYQESDELYIDFKYQKCMTGETGEIPYGENFYEKRVLIRDGVERYRLVPPNSRESAFRKIKRSFLPEPLRLVLECESGWCEIPLTEKFATEKIFASKGINDVWIVEHPMKY